MGLRSRVLLTSATIVALGAVAAAGIGSLVVLEGFRDLEVEDAQRDLERARQALDADVDNLAALATDWGAWNDTRAFIDDPAGNTDYLESNLQVETFLGVALNLIVLADADQEVLHAGAVDLTTESFVDPTPLVDAVQDAGLLVPFEDPDGARSGLVRIGADLWEVSVRAVTDSTGTAPPNGTLTMARWVSDEVVADLADRTQLDLAVEVTDAPVRDVGETSTDDTITLWAPLHDLTGLPVAELSVAQPRSMMAQGSSSVRTMVIVVVAVLASAGVLLLGVADRQVLRRLRRLGADIHLVGDSADGSLRVHEDERGDEITEVARHMNQTLGSLERTQQDLQLRNLELEGANGELEEANLARRRFLSAISHDLRSPLTSIQGFVRLLERRWDALAPDQRLEFLRRIDARTVTMDAMIEDLLTLSRLEQGTVVARPVPVEVLEVLRPVVAEADGAVLGGEAVTALVDPDHLRRIVTNLLDNARKYGVPPVEVSCAQHRGTVEVRVRDHGAGVEESFRPALFEAFSQATSAADLGQGVGLGLSIVQHLATQNGGRIDYEPPPDGGACFVVSLPSADATDRHVPVVTGSAPGVGTVH